MTTLNPTSVMFRRALCGALLSALIVPPSAHASVATLTAASASYNLGQFEQSRTEIFNAIKLEPTSYLKPEFVLLLSATYLASAEPAQSQAILDALKSEYPVYNSDPNAVRIQAGIWEQQGQLEKAQAILGKFPTGESLYHLAILLDRSGQTFAAVTRLKELLEKSPTGSLAARAQLALASAYLRLGESASATTALNSTGMGTDKETAVYHSFLKTAAAFKSANPAEAKAGMSQLQTADPALAGIAATFGGTELLNSDPSTAIDLLNDGVTNGSNQSRFLAAVALSAGYLQQSHPEKAVAAVNSALPLVEGTDRDRLVLIRGVAEQRSNQLATALDDFQSVIQRTESPWRGRALALAAHTLWYNNEFTHLITDFSKTLGETRRSMASSGKAEITPADASHLLVCDLLVANAQYALRRYREGELLYAEILRHSPDKNLTAEAVSGLVACQIFQKKFTEAQKALDELTVRFGEDRDVVRFGLHSQANLNWNQERYAPAVAQYQKYIEMFPADERVPFCLYQIGRCQERLGNLTAALAAWTTLRANYSKSAYSYNALVRSAQVAEATGDKTLSEKLYAETARSDHSDAAEMALISMGRQQLETGRTEQAIDTLDQLCTRFPLTKDRLQADRMLRDAYQRLALTQPQSLPTLQAKYAASFHAGEALYQQAVQAFDKADYKTASELFQKTWSAYPRTPSAAVALFYHGESLYRLNDYEAAIGSLHQFILNNPDHDMVNQARLRQSKSLEALGQSEEAAKGYREILAKSPQSESAAQAAIGLALALDRLGQYEEETVVCRNFVAQHSDHLKANALTWRLGQLERRAGHYTAALTQFQKVHAEANVATDDEIKQTIAALETMAQATPATHAQ